MKIAAYSCRRDEQEFFELYGKQYGVELVTTRDALTMDTIHLAKGCGAVCVITTPVTAEMIEQLSIYGVKEISTRTVGYEHVDLKKASELGIVVSNVSYSPYTVAEYTVMTILMTMRRMKAIMSRYAVQDFSLKDVRGAELRTKTIGVVGTGRIGETVIRILSGFGCKILACDLHEKEELKQLTDYVSLEKIWSDSDVITFHTPATKESFHMVNRQTIANMKDGVILVNQARGSLIDTDALIEGLESKKVGAAALDVIEGEGEIYYQDFKYLSTRHHQMAVLQAMPNVLMTPHTAFFSDQAVSDMVRYSIESCVMTMSGQLTPRKVNGNETGERTN